MLEPLRNPVARNLERPLWINTFSSRSSRTGALDEAMSDIFGALLVDRETGATGDDIWLWVKTFTHRGSEVVLFER